MENLDFITKSGNKVYQLDKENHRVIVFDVEAGKISWVFAELEKDPFVPKDEDFYTSHTSNISRAIYKIDEFTIIEEFGLDVDNDEKPPIIWQYKKLLSQDRVYLYVLDSSGTESWYKNNKLH